MGTEKPNVTKLSEIPQNIPYTMNINNSMLEQGYGNK